DVRAAGLGEGEALGVGAVEAGEVDRLRGGPDPGGVQQVGEAYAFEGGAGDPPAGDALDVPDQPGLRQGAQIGQGVGVRAVDQAADLQVVVGGGQPRHGR